jgi:hypothetical protein
MKLMQQFNCIISFSTLSRTSPATMQVMCKHALDLGYKWYTYCPF